MNDTKQQNCENADGESRQVEQIVSSLSPTMKDAYNFIKENGDKLYRHPGGFWSKKEWRSYREKYFGTNTIKALVARGVAEYTDWQQGRRGQFPVEITLLDITIVTFNNRSILVDIYKKR